jgi:hypothetical protein
VPRAVPAGPDAGTFDLPVPARIAAAADSRSEPQKPPQKGRQGVGGTGLNIRSRSARGLR